MFSDLKQNFLPDTAISKEKKKEEKKTFLNF